MIASFPMYEYDWNRSAHDRLWAGIRASLGYGPSALRRGGDPWDDWRDPALLVSQTCGMPYRNHLRDQVRLIGTPDYGLSDRPGHYHSVYVVRQGNSTTVSDYAARVFAFNDRGSQSGWAAPQCDAAARGFAFANTLQTGAHAASARAVAEGRADIASLDCVTWSLIRDRDPAFAGLTEIDRTPSTPGLPFITAPDNDRQKLFVALEQAIAGLDPADRQSLGLRGIVWIEAREYLAIPNPPV